MDESSLLNVQEIFNVNLRIFISSIVTTLFLSRSGFGFIENSTLSLVDSSLPSKKGPLFLLTSRIQATIFTFGTVVILGYCCQYPIDDIVTGGCSLSFCFPQISLFLNVDSTFGYCLRCCYALHFIYFFLATMKSISYEGYLDRSAKQLNKWKSFNTEFEDLGNCFINQILIYSIIFYRNIRSV